MTTGSSAGIGKAIALLFSNEGASVTIHGQSIEKLNATRDEMLLQTGTLPENVLIISGPIQNEGTQRELIEKTIARFGKLDILVNNVGQSRKPDLADPLDIEHFDYVMNVNVRSLVFFFLTLKQKR